MTAFDSFMKFIWRPENDGERIDSAYGEQFITVKGVTSITWHDAQLHKIISNAIKLQDATDAELQLIIKWCCWDRCYGGQFSDAGLPGIALVLANMAMVAGSHAAIRILQHLLLVVNVDGSLGPKTFASTLSAAHSGRAMIGELTEAYITYFTALDKAALFLHGWTRRARDCEKLAHSMLIL
jgi:lysozyme family protein